MALLRQALADKRNESAPVASALAGSRTEVRRISAIMWEASVRVSGAWQVISRLVFAWLAAPLAVLVWFASSPAFAQDAAVDGEKLFRSQCSTCHSLSPVDAPRQGPNLAHVYGRKIGAVEGYDYTNGYRESGQIWGEDTLDAYLTSPQKMFPGSTMAYRQSKPDVRRAIIAFLKEQG